MVGTLGVGLAVPPSSQAFARLAAGAPRGGPGGSAGRLMGAVAPLALPLPEPLADGSSEGPAFFVRAPTLPRAVEAFGIGLAEPPASGVFGTGGLAAGAPLLGKNLEGRFGRLGARALGSCLLELVRPPAAVDLLAGGDFGGVLGAAGLVGGLSGGLGPLLGTRGALAGLVLGVVGLRRALGALGALGGGLEGSLATVGVVLLPMLRCLTSALAGLTGSALGAAGLWLHDRCANVCLARGAAALGIGLIAGSLPEGRARLPGPGLGVQSPGGPACQTPGGGVDGSTGRFAGTGAPLATAFPEPLALEAIGRPIRCTVALRLERFAICGVTKLGLGVKDLRSSATMGALAGPENAPLGLPPRASSGSSFVRSSGGRSGAPASRRCALTRPRSTRRRSRFHFPLS